MIRRLTFPTAATLALVALCAGADVAAFAGDRAAPSRRPAHRPRAARAERLPAGPGA